MSMGNSSSAVAPSPDASPAAAVTIHLPAEAAATQPPLSLSTHLADVRAAPSPNVTAPGADAVSTAPVQAPASPVTGNPPLQYVMPTAAELAGTAPNGAIAAAAVADPIAPNTPSAGGGDSPKASAAEEAARSAYAQELKRQHRLLPAVPNVTITFSGLGAKVPIPVVDRGFETIGGRLWDTATFAGFRGKHKTKDFEMVSGVSGVIRPGTLTLILAPPGHGKSTLLKTIATRIAPTDGSIRYNGLTQAEALEAGVYVNKLVQYVDQADVHNPLLTVAETFQFAVDNFCVNPASMPDVQASASAADKEALQKLHESKADAMVAMLGLGECRDTILGNALLRGVSGGQKKRVTLGETVLSEARVLCLDEVTNGLDSSTALDIFRALRTWAHVTGGSVITALQQPTPELFALFDELVLLKEGHCVYNGSALQAIPYLESLGYSCPPDSDFCDFMVEFLTHPRHVYSLQQARASVVTPPPGTTPFSAAFGDDNKQNGHSNGHANGHANGNGNGHAANGAGIELTVFNKPAVGSVIPSTTDELEKAFASTNMAKAAREQIAASESNPKANAVKGFLLNDYCRALYGHHYAHSFMYHLTSNVKRQRELNGRNKGLTGPRIGQAIMMSLLLGSLFYDTGITMFPERIALILFALTFVAFGNMSELPIAVEAKRVLYKQTDAGMFPTTVYVLGVVLCHLPLLIGETTIFTIVIYFLTSFTNDAGAFFIFLAIMICSGLCMSVFFRMLAFVAPNEEIAQALAGPSTGIFMLFGGFFVTRSSVPDFMIWLYWLSPFSWSVRSLAVNEFRQTRYKEYEVPGAPAGTPTVDIGQLYLDTYEMYAEHTWVWNGPLLLLGYFLALSALSVVVLQYQRYELSRGTKRFEEADKSDAAAAKHDDGQHASATASALPFTPVTLSFHGVSYTIVDDKGRKRELLHNVSGYAQPKTLTALMGVSGAGKTTLMDVIAGRKTQGVIDGRILVNGKVVSPAKFARLSGYVEQDDIHNPTATVRETLLFAAHLRLPQSVPAAAKEKFVDEILDLLELTDISDELIGNAVILGLSPGQLKRVTIGVELVANPTILFLDEPTTGLDSRSAYTVMRVIKKIAASGRSVVCTIHQPSAELFYMFDALLLLAPGGVQTYFGPVGYRARGLVQYFEGLGAPRKPRRMNPASWMLDVIGAGTGLNKADAVVLDVKQNGDGSAKTVAPAKASPDFGAAYTTSPLAKHCDDTLAGILAQASGVASPAPGVAGAGGAGGDVELTRYATGLGTQFYHYMIRLFRSYWRNLPFIWNRGVVLLILSVVFGLVYFDLPTDTQGNVLSRISVMFVTGGFAGIIHSATSLPVLMDQRAVYYRERSANTYSSIVYSLSIFVVELPFIAIYNAMFLAIAYFMIGLENDGTAWAKYYFAHIMLSYCYVSMAHFLTSVMPNKLVAGIVQGMYFSMFFLFGGMLVNGENVPAGWKWMWHWTPVHHALESLVMPQFEGVTKSISIVVGAGTVEMPIRDFVSQYLAFDYGNYWEPLGWLALFILVTRLLVIICMEKISFIKR